MSELLHHVEQSILGRRLFRPGQRILAAVSGGADSMVLLHVLHELAEKHKWRLTVAHFNHRLRGRSSDADEGLVRRTAGRLKLPVVVEAAEVRELARAQRLSLEMAARKLRHDFLARTARGRDIPTVALAHHADDQLELFFLRLLRGSGGEGLAGMKWRNASPSDAEVQLVRPLLDQPKAVLGEYAAEQRIRFREDASNARLDFQRNRIRHELLPLLRKNYQPALDRTISRVIDIVGAEAEFTARAAEEWLRAGGRPKAEVRFDDLPVAVQRRCVQMQLLGLGIEPGYELVEQLRVSVDRPVALSRTQTPGENSPKGVLRALAPLTEEGEHPTSNIQHPTSKGTCLRHPWRLDVSEAQGQAKAREAGESSDAPATRQGDRGHGMRYAVRDNSGIVHLQVTTREEFNPSSKAVDLDGKGGKIEFDGVRVSWRADARKAVAPARAGVQQESFDADKVGSPIRLRHWRPGDRFQPIGMACAVKLQDFFTNQKIPRERRRQLLVAATAQGEVFWVEGTRISERFKLTRETIRRLQWRWKRL